MCREHCKIIRNVTIEKIESRIRFFTHGTAQFPYSVVGRMSFPTDARILMVDCMLGVYCLV